MTSLHENIQSTLAILIPKFQNLQIASKRPIILGITGLQGSGKSTWASTIVDLLWNDYQLRAITISLDDLYKSHDDLVAQREKNPENKLFRTRGQPGTHDEHLAGVFFEAVNQQEGNSELLIPRFDKSEFSGEGDRAPKTGWTRVDGKVDVVIFEGWCVGFQALPDGELRSRYEAAVASRVVDEPESITTLADHQLEHLLEVNSNLKRYNDAFIGPKHFDFMIHIDTDDLRNVYHWRIQQEHALIEAKGSGMTDEAVVAFVRGYMPAYQLYLDELRNGFFGGKSERQVRVVLDKGRQLEKTEVI